MSRCSARLQRQRQLEFLQNTNNPTDMEIMGMTGRGAVLRSVSQTIGLDGDKVVPARKNCSRSRRPSSKQGQQQAINERVDQGIQPGVQQGVSEDFVGADGGLSCLPGAMPGEQPGGPSWRRTGPRWCPPGGPGPPGGPMAQGAAQAQGNAAHAAVQSTVTSRATQCGNQPALPGPGVRPPSIGGGPG